MNRNEKTTLVPRLRFPEYVMDGAINFEAGDVIFEPISNKNHNSYFPVLAITQEHGAIPRDQIDYNVSVTDKILENYKVVEIGDFIISLRSFQGGIEYSLYHGICSPAYIILRKRVPVVEQYYKHYFKTGKFIQDLNKDLEGIRDGKMVSYSQFSAIILPKPDNKEQQKIADCLSSLDDLITAEDKKLEALRAHKKDLMRKLFPAEDKTVPEWRFPEFRGCGEWGKKTIGSSCTCFSGGTPDTSKKEYYSGNIPLIRSGEIDKETTALSITKEGLDNSSAKMVQIGDVLVALYGANSGEVSLSKIKGAINQAILCLRHENNNAFVYQYLFHKKSWIISTYIQGGQGNLSGEIVKSIELNFPKPEEQQKIVDCLSGIDDLLGEQAKKIKTLKTHKKGLMQGLFPSIEEVGK